MRIRRAPKVGPFWSWAVAFGMDKEKDAELHRNTFESRKLEAMAKQLRRREALPNMQFPSPPRRQG